MVDEFWAAKNLISNLTSDDGRGVEFPNIPRMIGFLPVFKSRDDAVAFSGSDDVMLLFFSDETEGEPCSVKK